MKDLDNDLEFQKLVKECEDYIYKTIDRTRKRYRRNEIRAYNELILNQPSIMGEDLYYQIKGDDDVTCNWSFLDSIDSENIFRALKVLNKKDYKIIKLKFFNDYSNDEITKIMNFKNKHVTKVHINRALDKIRIYMLRRDLV